MCVAAIFPSSSFGARLQDRCHLQRRFFAVPRHWNMDKSVVVGVRLPYHSSTRY